MKVGILTFHSADNYGSVLQTFALQEYCGSLMGEGRPDIIDFIPEGQKERYRLFSPVRSPRNIVGNILKAPLFNIYYNRKKTFAAFRKKYFSLSSLQTSNEEEITEYLTRYKMIIVGSDQVWNPDCVDFSKVYMLDGVKMPFKVSYAASLNEEKIQDKEWYINCVNDFDHVSVREQSSMRYLRQLGLDTFGEAFKPITVAVDPTLLIDAEIYRRIAAPKIVQGEYIFAYSVYNNPEWIDWLEQVASKTELPIVVMYTGSHSYKLKKNKSIVFAKDQSPESFLSGVMNAKYVITNSFHGTAFSIIFKKDFYYFGDYTKDIRIKTIVEDFELQNRCVMDARTEYFTDKMVYVNYEANMSRVRKASEMYLKEVFNDYERYSLQK